MSLPLTQFDRWQSGTNQNSIPANNNSLRSEIFNTDGVSKSVAAQPGSPSDGQWYVIPAGATGTQWAGFAENSVAVFYGGTWYEFIPQSGNVLQIDGVMHTFDGSDWGSYVVPATVVKPVEDVDIVGGVATLDCDGGLTENFTLLLDANATLAVTGLAGAGKVTEFEVQIKQDATGSRTLTLPVSFKALGGSDTAIASAANAVTILSAKTFDNGTTWRYAMQESA